MVQNVGRSAPLNAKALATEQMVPLIELPVDTTIKGGTLTNASTMNPGLSYAGVVYQVAAEATIPLNRQEAAASGSPLGSSSSAGSFALVVR